MHCPGLEGGGSLLKRLAEILPDFLEIEFLSWLSRSKSQKDKEHRIALRGFVSLKGRTPDLSPGGPIFGNSPVFVAMKEGIIEPLLTDTSSWLLSWFLPDSLTGFSYILAPQNQPFAWGAVL